MGAYIHENVKKALNECVQRTSIGSFFSGKSGLRLYCKRLPNFETQITTSPKGKVWVGIDHMESGLDMKLQQTREIKRHIFHRYSYGGKKYYAQEGGYDITLIEVEEPFAEYYSPVCLPGPNFDDIRMGKRDTVVAGYGLHLRKDKKT